jgi:hypothetical protein
MDRIRSYDAVSSSETLTSEIHTEQVDMKYDTVGDRALL